MSRWRRSPGAPPRSPRESHGPEEPSWKPHPAPAAASLRPLLRLQVAARRAGEREPEPERRAAAPRPRRTRVPPPPQPRGSPFLPPARVGPSRAGQTRGLASGARTRER